MFNNLIKYYFPSSNIPDNEESTTINPIFSTDTRVEIECKEFLPEVYDTWSFIQKLSTDTTRFHEMYNLYKYERSENQQRYFFDQLKILDDTIYKLSLSIHQRIQALEQIVQPALNEFHMSIINEEQTSNYTPAYIRIAQNQLNSLKLSFKRIIIKHNSDSIDYQNDLKRSVQYSKTIVDSYQQISRATIDKIKTLFNSDEEERNITSNVSPEQTQLQISEEKQHYQLNEQELQIADLEARLESVRILKERVRQMKYVFPQKLLL
jgi:hypothetical protein